MRESTTRNKKAHSASHLNEARQYWWNEDYLALLSERLDLDQCQTLADIGCGQGMMAFKFAPFLSPGAAVYGLDSEKTYIKSARRRAKFHNPAPSIHFFFEEGNAYELPYDDDHMDVSICQTLLIHLEEPQRAIAEMQRITKPGGWIVAFEPNNLVQHLMFDRYQETDYEVEEVLRMMEIRLRVEQGKKALGEGFNSLGDVLPDLYRDAGLEDIQVWISDKAMPIIPPYDTKEKRTRVGQLITWLQTGEGGLGYEENLRYYLAGGGKKGDFDEYWQRVGTYKLFLLDKLKNQEYISAGGSVMYVVAGRVPEA